MPSFWNFFLSVPLTIESPTIAQVLDGQWNYLLVSVVLFMFSFLDCGPLNHLAFSLFFGILQEQWFTASVQKIFVMLFFPFLIISFLVVISDLKSLVSFSRLVINFLSTSVWYSYWLCKLIFCFTLFYIKSHISFFISGSRTSLFFCT